MFRPVSGPPSGPASGPAGFPQQGAPYPPYGQPPVPPPPPYGARPGPPAGPPPGYPPYGPPPPRGKNNRTWLIGGIVVAVVMLLLLVLGIVVVDSVLGEDVKYRATNDLCGAFDHDSFDDLELEVSDSTPPRSQQSTRGKIEVRECRVSYQGAGRKSRYASLTAQAEVNPTARRAQDEYESWVRYSTTNRQSGREVRDIASFGQAAKVLIERTGSSITVELHGYDDNLELELRFYGDSDTTRNIDEIINQLTAIGQQIMRNLQVPSN